MKPSKEQLDLVSDITEREVFIISIDGVWYYGSVCSPPKPRIVWFVAAGYEHVEKELCSTSEVYVPNKKMFLSLIPCGAYHQYLLQVSDA